MIFHMIAQAPYDFFPNSVALELIQIFRLICMRMDQTLEE